MSRAYFVQLAYAPNGNPQIELLPVPPEYIRHPTFPPIALPGRDFPTSHDAMRYARALLVSAGVLRSDSTPLRWDPAGYTLRDDQITRQPVYRAQLPQA